MPAPGAIGPRTSEAERHMSTTMSGPNRMQIRVMPCDWGGAGVEDIGAVLRSAAAELLRYTPGLLVIPISVQHRGQGYPETLPHRSVDGNIVIVLNAQGHHWAQFAYQFIHELCHVLSNHAQVLPSEERWFDEAVCEAASLFTLLGMARTWESSPPYPNWSDYAAGLRDYAHTALNEGHRRLRPGTDLAHWYEQQRGHLREDRYWREGTELVANQLLPLFMTEPSAWEAIKYLNVGGTEPRPSFEAHLSAWYAASPVRLRQFVSRIASLFGLCMGRIPG